MNGPAGEPVRAAGRTDATGPLPVAVPADATGPMPTPPVDSAPQAPGPADATGPQPLLDGEAAENTAAGTADDTASGAPTGPVAATPSWFAEGEPVDGSATGTAPGTPTDGFPAAMTPAAAPQVDSAPVSHVAVPTPAPSTSFFDAVPPPPADTGAAPATGFFPTVEPHSADAGAAPATGLFESVPPAPVDAGPAPATGLFEAVPPPPADTGAAPATSLFESVGPYATDTGTAPATGLFDAVPPLPAGTGGPPATNLFEPATPHPTGTGAAPATGLFEAVGSAGAPTTGATGAGGASPPIVPVDSTGPMAAVGAAPAVAPKGSAPGSGGPTANGAPPVTTAVPLVAPDGTAPAGRTPHTDAWSFGPDSGALPGPDTSESNGEGGGRVQVRSRPPITAPAPATTAAGAQRRPRRWPLTLLGVLVAIAGGIALVFTFAQTDPSDVVASATEDLADWNGVRYQGAIAALDGGEIQFDLTVTADGTSGTLTRNGGQATADVLWDESGTLLRANREWWLYHHGARADDLADTWVADPLTETQEIDPILALHPDALVQHIRPEPAATWEAIEQRLVGGRTAILLSDGTRRLVVSNDRPNRLLALDIAPTERAAPVQVADVPAEEAGAVGGEAAAVRSAESPKTLTQRLRERPVVEIKLEPEPLCVSEACGVTVTVTNSGAVPARGHLEISADGQIVATHPMDVHPGQAATFTATAPNPHFTDPGSTGEILWESRAVDD